MARPSRNVRHKGASVHMPADLNSRMRRTLQSFCPDLSEDAQDRLWEALKQDRLKPKGDGAEHV